MKITYLPLALSLICQPTTRFDRHCVLLQNVDSIKVNNIFRKAHGEKLCNRCACDHRMCNNTATDLVNILEHGGTAETTAIYGHFLLTDFDS